MPVRSLNSSVLVWPCSDDVICAARGWADAIAARRPEIVRIGYFGSYARGDAGVGSDLDLVAIVTTIAAPFPLRPIAWDTTSLPVPADLLIYSAQEWADLTRGDRGFGRTLRDETKWLYAREEAHA